MLADAHISSLGYLCVCGQKNVLKIETGQRGPPEDKHLVVFLAVIVWPL